MMKRFVFNQVTCLWTVLRSIFKLLCPSLNWTYLSHGDVPKLWRKWKDSEELNLTESGLQQLVVGLNGVVSDVEVTGDASQICNLHS